MTSLMQPLPLEKWSALRDSMKRDWPQFLYFYNYLNKAISWKTKDILIKDNIYCPDSNPEAGVFIMITEYLNVIYLFAFDESKHILEEILYKTDKIRWTDSFYFETIQESVQGMLENYLNTEAKSKGMKYYRKLSFACWSKPKEDCMKMNVEIPEECYLKRIEEEDIPMIHSHWLHKNDLHPERSLNYLSTLIRTNASYGLFFKKDKTLVSWNLQCNHGCPAVLFTVEEYRRKGYGKTVVKALTKYIAENDNVDVTVYIDEGNVASENFFGSMGFQKVVNLARYNVNQ